MLSSARRIRLGSAIDKSRRAEDSAALPNCIRRTNPVIDTRRARSLFSRGK